MARRTKKEEIVEVVEEVKVADEIENPIEVPEIKGTVKKATKKKASVKITAPRVNIRKSPSLIADVQKIAVAGDKFELVHDGEDGFYEILCDGSNAFVMKDFAELA